MPTKNCQCNNALCKIKIFFAIDFQKNLFLLWRSFIRSIIEFIEKNDLDDNLRMSNVTLTLSRQTVMDNEKIFGVIEAQNFLRSVTAPWVQDLNLKIDSVSKWKCKFTLDYSEKLVRSGNIICGQAIVSAADTAMIVAVISAIGKYQEITTVDIACKYLRPLMKKGGSLETEILKLGQRLVVGRITIKDIASDKLAAEISCTYARL